MSHAILISTEQGQAAVRISGRWYPIDLAGHSPSVIRCVWEDGPSNYWFGGADGLTHVNNGRVVEFGIANNLPRRPLSNAYRDSNGTLWVSSWGDSIASMVGNGFARIDQAMGLCHSDVNGFAEDSQGRLWVATDQGISIYSRGSFLSCSFVDFFGDSNVKSIVHDDEHRIYLGTVGAVWIAHPDGHMTQLTINEGLPQKTAQVIFIDNQRRCWLGTWGGGVVMLTEDWQVSKSLAFPDATHVGAITQDDSGAIWVGSLTSGLWCLPTQSSWTSIAVPNGMQDIRVVRAIPKLIAQQLLAMASHS